MERTAGGESRTGLGDRCDFLFQPPRTTGSRRRRDPCENSSSRYLWCAVRRRGSPRQLKLSVSTHPPNSLESFGRTAEAVAATTKKLEKARLLGEYFEHLRDEDLSRAARYFAGQQFAQSDVRTTNVGGSILSEAMCLATGVDPETLGPRYARWGDAGEVAFEIFCEAKPSNEQIGRASCRERV